MGLRGAVAGLSCAVALASAPGAHAETLGSRQLGVDSSAGLFCGGFEDCAYTQTKLPGAHVKAPFDGRIKRWRVRLIDPGSIRLVVMQKLDGGRFEAIRASGIKEPSGNGVSAFDADLRISKGQLIGLSMLDENATLSTITTTGARYAGFEQAFAPGEVQPPDSHGMDELQFNATVRH